MFQDLHPPLKTSGQRAVAFLSSCGRCVFHTVSTVVQWSWCPRGFSRCRRLHYVGGSERLYLSCGHKDAVRETNDWTYFLYFLEEAAVTNTDAEGCWTLEFPHTKLLKNTTGGTPSSHMMTPSASAASVQMMLCHISFVYLCFSFQFEMVAVPTAAAFSWGVRLLA